MDRQRGSNVIDADYDRKSILGALDNRLACGGRLKSESIYGDGKAGPRIADILATAPLRIEKTLSYLDAEDGRPSAKLRSIHG